MAVPARLQTLPAADQRGFPRRKLCLGSNLQHSGESVTIHDVSATGLLIETSAVLAPSDSFELELPEVGATPATVVWSSGRYYGCQFKERLPGAAISAALLRSEPRTENGGPPRLPAANGAKRATASELLEIPVEFDDQKASLTVRMRVILGSALILWTLIIWVGWLLIKLIRANWG